MRTTETSKSIWSAALIAAKCRAHRPEGRSYNVRWQAENGHLSFVAQDAVVIEPFGVRLNAGEVLEVCWPPNATAYTLAVRPAGGAQ
jgi:hypothetical protein